MQGSIYRPLFIIALSACLLCAGCNNPLHAKAQGIPLLRASDAPTVALRLGDLPQGFIQTGDLTPDTTQLSDLLQSSSNAMTGRQGGVWRTFAYTQPEPTTMQGIVRTRIEVDIFATPAQAQAWLTQRTQATASAGPILNGAAPGAYHFTRVSAYHAGDIAATTSVLGFTERNVYVEITSVGLAQGVSLSEPDRYADIIDGRIRSL